MTVELQIQLEGQQSENATDIDTIERDEVIDIITNRESTSDLLIFKVLLPSLVEAKIRESFLVLIFSTFFATSRNNDLLVLYVDNLLFYILICVLTTFPRDYFTIRQILAVFSYVCLIVCLSIPLCLSFGYGWCVVILGIKMYCDYIGVRIDVEKVKRVMSEMDNHID